VTSKPEHKSPYKHSPYTNNKSRKRDAQFVVKASQSSFDIFDNWTQKIHTDYMTAAASGDSAESARMARVYREHIESIHQSNLRPPVLDLPEEEEPRSESVEELDEPIESSEPEILGEL